MVHVCRVKKLFSRLCGAPARVSRGFTLLEVMVALAILAVGLTALLGSQHQTMFVAEDNDFLFVSSQLASYQMAEILGSTASEVEIILTARDFGDNYQGYSWQVAIEPATLPFGQAGVRLEKIKLQVLDKRRNRRFTLTRYRFPAGAR